MLTGGDLALIAQPEVRLDTLITLKFADGDQRFWGGVTAKTINGLVYQPTYGQAQIEGLRWSAEAVADEITITLNGLDDDLLGTALNAVDDVVGRLARFDLQFFNADWEPVGMPRLTTWAIMQPPKISRTAAIGYEGGQQTVVLPCENIFYGRDRYPGGTYTDRDQQTRYPGDLMFTFVPSLVNKTVTYPDF